MRHFSEEGTKISEKNIQIISAEDAEKMFICASEYVQVLKAYDDFEEEAKFLQFGPHWYKVEDLDTDYTFWILADNATKITDLCFLDYPPEVEFVKPLFESNTIKTLAFTNTYDFYQQIPTESIETLIIRIWENRGNVKSFEGVSTVAKL